ncbi:hypothetical protein UF75_2169 [Desulfosporosinus sp. I2]|nr:hypothetical protein UF75_2169 [Desulfosporosinus sp. I2]
MKKEYRIDEIPEFIYRSNGKPYLKNRGDIYFSFSHCKGVAACMIGDS